MTRATKRHRRHAGGWLAMTALFGWCLAAGAAQGGVLVTVTDGVVAPPIPLALTTLELQGVGVMPLGDGFADRDVRVTIALSPGQAVVGNRQLFDPLAPPGTVQKELNSGDPALFVDSFFDVFVDITISDADASDGSNIATALGAPIVLGGVRTQLGAASFLAVVDTSQPNLGVRPGPTALFSAYQFDFGSAAFDLGADLDGDGNTDVLTLGSPMSCAVPATDVTGFPTVSSALQCDFSGGINPPFSVLLDGPIIYDETPVFPAVAAPEPAAGGLFVLALAGLVALRRRFYSGSSSVSQ